MQKNNISGCRFGKLIVMKRAQNTKDGKTQWLCQCDCGNSKIIRKSDLITGKTKSCGCLRKEITKNLGFNNKTHGKTNTRIYRIWQAMKSRCYYKKNIQYQNYGERGIKICDEWLDKGNGFINFYNWAINNGYKDNLTIDRRNVNGNYEPNNCRWTSMKTQENNRRNNHKINYDNKNYTVSQLSKKINIPKATLLWRINNGWNENELKIPVDLANRIKRKEIKK